MKANDDQAQQRACGRRLGVVHHLPAAQFDHGREAGHGAVQRHRPLDERAGRRTGRLHVRPDRQRGAADQGRHHQGLCDRDAGAQSVAARRADHQGGRPAGIRGLGLERAVRPEGHAESRWSTSSPTRSTRRSTTRACASGCSISAATFPTARAAARRALGALVKSEVDKWGKVIKEAGAEVN